ncbi:hypothetical protein PLESTB_001054500 [Pleodorina starrii]|uniref:alcohol dehydrogenase (NADP(+)) n=1 Tax=Pleodorina starrii TaxID=330485 RepID=A0A9W6F4B4_9CHLO|nr:hypothetical protein PLESTB_001054500 [Pleodorina starrii]
MGPRSAATAAAPAATRGSVAFGGSRLLRIPALPRCRCRRAAAAAATPLAFRENEVKPDLNVGVKEQAEAFRIGQAQRLTRRGWAVLDKKGTLTPWSHTPGELGPRQVDIRVTHNGLCHTDLHMRDDDWGLSKFPFIPGHEVVGEVVAVGESVDSMRPGDRVGVGWIADSCRRCLACLRGDENVCEKGYTGLIVEGNHGGFQEICRVRSDFVYSIPDGLGSASAAPLLCAGVTVYAPLRRHLTRPGARVGVLGVGGLGHLALQFANKMGGDVTALDISPDKEEESRQLGAHSFRTWGSATGAEEGLQGHFDVILNCASANIPTGQLLSLLKNDGTLVQVGIPGGGATMSVPLQDLVFGQKKVAGTIVGGRADMQEMLDFAGVHGVRPLVELMPLSEVNEGMKRVAEGKARYRVVLISDWQ